MKLVSGPCVAVICGALMTSAAQAKCVTEIRAPKSLGPVLFAFEKRDPKIADEVFVVWDKRVGDHVKPSDYVAFIETIVVVDGPGAVPSGVELKPSNPGTLTEIIDHQGATVHPGELLARMTCK